MRAVLTYLAAICGGLLAVMVGVGHPPEYSRGEAAIQLFFTGAAAVALFRLSFVNWRN